MGCAIPQIPHGQFLTLWRQFVDRSYALIYVFVCKDGYLNRDGIRNQDKVYPPPPQKNRPNLHHKKKLPYDILWVRIFHSRRRQDGGIHPPRRRPALRNDGHSDRCAKQSRLRPLHADPNASARTRRWCLGTRRSVRWYWTQAIHRTTSAPSCRCHPPEAMMEMMAMCTHVRYTEPLYLLMLLPSHGSPPSLFAWSSPPRPGHQTGTFNVSCPVSWRNCTESLPPSAFWPFHLKTCKFNFQISWISVFAFNSFKYWHTWIYSDWDFKYLLIIHYVHSHWCGIRIGTPISSQPVLVFFLHFWIEV